jgi:ribosomal-protein-serine acetyltransferase
MGWVAQEPMSAAGRREWVLESEREWASRGDVFLGIFVGGEPAGACGLHRRLGPGGLEIGYWVHPGFLRRGVATGAARLLTDAAFTVPGVAVVEIHHDRANVASRGVPRALGYEFVGEFPDEPEAPGEVGVECRWRMERERWPGLNG